MTAPDFPFAFGRGIPPEGYTPRQPERTCRTCGVPLERSRQGDVCGLHESGLAGNEPRVA